MIYTITFNPAVDLVFDLNNFSSNSLNRANKQQMFAGGKGINVSRVLKTLGRESTAIGFVGGFTGKFIYDSLNELGIKSHFIKINDNSRINVKILSDNETEINGPSPKLTKDNINELINIFDDFKKDDLIIISGSLPDSISLETFEKLLNILNKNDVKFVVDTSNEALLASLKYNPFLIKPNKVELENVFGNKVHSEEEIKKLALELVDKGAKNVIVSLGKDGAIFVNKTEYYKVNAIEGKVINTVGSGDSFVAGFIDEYLKTYDFYKSLQKGVFVGCATAFSFDLANKDKINSLFKK